MQRFLLLVGLGVTLAGITVLLLPRPTGSGGPKWSLDHVYRALHNPRKAYARWRIDHETSEVMKLIRDADICLVADRSGFTRTKPLASDGHAVRTHGKDALPSLVQFPAYTGGRATVTVRIPSEWIVNQQTTNASGTEMEDFALEVATKLKDCGFHRIAVYETAYGMSIRVFDGEVPSRRAIDTTVQWQMALMSRL